MHQRIAEETQQRRFLSRLASCVGSRPAGVSGLLGTSITIMKPDEIAPATPALLGWAQGTFRENSGVRGSGVVVVARQHWSSRFYGTWRKK